MSGAARRVMNVMVALPRCPAQNTRTGSYHAARSVPVGQIVAALMLEHDPYPKTGLHFSGIMLVSGLAFDKQLVALGADHRQQSADDQDRRDREQTAGDRPRQEGGRIAARDEHGAAQVLLHQ